MGIVPVPIRQFKKANKVLGDKEKDKEDIDILDKRAQKGADRDKQEEMEAMQRTIQDLQARGANSKIENAQIVTSSFGVGPLKVR